LNSATAWLRTILTGIDVPKIRQPADAPPSIINNKTVADFTRVVEQTGILARETPAPKPCDEQ
jgi:hypothetical protein